MRRLATDACSFEDDRVPRAPRESEGDVRYRRVVEHSPDPVIIHRDGVIVYVNPAGLRLYGTIAPEEVVGRDLLALIHPDDRDLARRRLAEVARGATAPLVEIRVICPDGRELTMESTATATIEGGVAAVQVIARDVTDRKRAEREREAMETLLVHTRQLALVGSMARGIAHDLNNMLAVIVTATEHARRAIGASAPAESSLAVISEAASRSCEFVRGILAFATRRVHEPGPIQVGDHVMSDLRLLGQLAGRGVEIRCDVPDDATEAVVVIDRVQLDQCLVNLVLNARDAMEGFGVIELRVRDVEIADEDAARSGIYVEITCADTGGGIPPALHARIFEPYFTTKGHGTGIGLATIRDIVEGLGGAVSVANRREGGARFRVLIPRASGCGSTPRAARPRPRAQDDALANGTST